jgi:uncharacterized repeat protein (TIGR03803 family)
MKAKSLQPVLRWAGVLTVSLILITAAHAANQYKVLHYFGNRPAAFPEVGLVADSAGNLYGTALGGSQSFGVIFKLTPGSGGKWSYRVIHRFTGPDGHDPSASLILDSLGNLYGMTQLGGAHNLGTVFELSPSVGSWKEQVLYSFGATSTDLTTPVSALLFDASGNLYGTAYMGGTNGKGGVFQLKPSGNAWQETVIYNFTGPDGAFPSNSLISDSQGNFYSTTGYGGGPGFGVVYELTPHSGGSWTETVLHSFTGGADGATPFGGVVFDAAGNLYGATFQGGLTSCNGGYGCGTVFQLTPSMGQWTHTVLHAFDDSDGAFSFGVVLDSAGNLYGTTEEGGHNRQGVVFKLSPSGNSWTETVLHFFNGKRGANPLCALIFDQQGVLYGTTNHGGIGSGNGVVFSLTP